VSLEKGILGYLSMKPLSGYDIKRLFDMSAAFFWPADQAQIYRSLKKLTEEGSIELAEYVQGETVNSKVYSITESGKDTFHQWLMDLQESDFIVRLPFVMHLFFSGELTPEEQLACIEEQCRRNQEFTQNLKTNYEENGDLFAELAGLPEGDRKLEAAMYAYRWGVLRGEAYGKLLEEIKEDIKGKTKDDKK